MQKLSMKLLLSITFLLVFNFFGNACSCIEPREIDEAQYNQYKLIVIGKIVSVKEERFEQIFKVQIETAYKAKDSIDIITVHTPQQEGECGIVPKKGEKWLLFAYWNGKHYSTYLCTRTKSMNPKAPFYNAETITNDIEFLERKKNVS